MAREIFISYSRHNLEKVKAIKSEIEHATDAECWMDLNAIESGSAQFTQDIVDGIKSCRVFLFMLSKESQGSKFALRELNFAMKKADAEKQKHVVIVNIDNSQMCDEFDFMYGLTDTIVWSNEPQREKLIRNLKERVCWDEEKEVKEIVLQKTEEPFIVLKDKSPSILQNLANNMVYVEGGSFHMGNSISRDCDAFEDEMPIHEVNISSFYICRYEVTQDEWMFVMGNNPSLFIGSKRPVDNISWDDCQLFVKKLNELTGKQFRLPTEVEWEYAARGGKLSHGLL